MPAATPRVAPVFRIQEIPVEKTTEQISQLLSEEFTEHKFKLSNLCPSCYGAKVQTAILEFTTTCPPVLLKLSNDERYPVPIDDDIDMFIDCGFLRMTQLYPTTGTIKADIIAIGGLNGHAYGSWSKTDLRNRRRMWLRHFLPRDIPDCRVILYGYDSNLSRRSDFMIPDFTDHFMEELSKIREPEEERKRPIIFMGHSFGGIIIAQSLVKARDNPENEKFTSILNATVAILFFATPHRGMIVDDILQMLGQGSPRQELVTSISDGSAHLKKDLQRFVDYTIGLKIVSFRETDDTKKVIQNADGSWSRSGEFYKTVGNQSSILQLPKGIEESFALKGDHSTLVKFPDNVDENYTTVVARLKQFAQMAAELKEKRAKQLREPPPSKSGTLPASPPQTPPRTKAAPSPNATPLSAVLGNNINDLDYFLRQSTAFVNDPVTHASRRTTLLRIAIEKGHAAIVSRLLKNGADCTTIGEDGFNPLQLVVKNGETPVVREILESGGAHVDAEAGDEHRSTALHLAVMHGRAAIARLLLRHQANVHARNKHGATPLLCVIDGTCTTREAEDLIAVLLDNGANIADKNNNGNYLLHRAARYSTVQVADALLKQGASLTVRDRYDNTPLHLTAWNAIGTGGAIATLFVRRDANKNARNCDSLTALECAVDRGKQDVIEALR